MTVIKQTPPYVDITPILKFNFSAEEYTTTSDFHVKMTNNLVLLIIEMFQYLYVAPTNYKYLKKPTRLESDHILLR